MSRVLIVYFSQGGTTARVARRIAAGLESTGHAVHLHNLSRATADRADPPHLRDYDLLGVGSPVHYFRLASPVSDFLSASATVYPEMPTFGFLLYGTYSGWAGKILARTLAARTGDCLGLFSCRGADRYLGYLRRGFLFSAGHPSAAELAAAEAFGAVIGARARARLGRSPAGPPDDAPTAVTEKRLGWVYRLERRLSAPVLARHVYSRFFRVKAERCTSCGACARRCPNGNVILSAQGLPTWGRDCLLCL